jgi:hypothetical protein
MSKMGQHVIDNPELIGPFYTVRDFMESLNSEEKKAEEEAGKPQVFTPIEEEPF